jgi:hypothetical protein
MTYVWLASRSPRDTTEVLSKGGHGHGDDPMVRVGCSADASSKRCWHARVGRARPLRLVHCSLRISAGILASGAACAVIMPAAAPIKSGSGLSSSDGAVDVLGGIRFEVLIPGPVKSFPKYEAYIQ